MEGKLPLN